jgi:hypothetical protein
LDQPTQGWFKQRTATMKKLQHPRSEKDFTIHSLTWDRDVVAKFARAGFDVPTDEQVVERFWRYLDFLQSRGLTSHIVAAKKEDVCSDTTLRNSDVTDAGFRFIQSIEKKWCSRILKFDDPAMHSVFLEKWFTSFQREQPVRKAPNHFSELTPGAVH